MLACVSSLSELDMITTHDSVGDAIVLITHAFMGNAALLRAGTGPDSPRYTVAQCKIYLGDYPFSSFKLFVSLRGLHETTLVLATYDH